MTVRSTFYTLFNRRRPLQIKNMQARPHKLQWQELMRLLKQAAGTEWGRKYDFSTINDVPTFQQRVPISSYEDLKKDIERMMKGEPNVLWRGKPQWFAKSSGTTNDKSKFIPVSKEALSTCHQQGGKDVLTFFIDNVPETNLFSGKMLTLGGSHRTGKHNSKVRIGDLSSIYLENVPFWAELFRTPPTKIALIDDFEEKLKRITEIAAKKKVTSILGVPSWNLVLLKHVLSLTGASNITEVWPHLEMFAHGGISFDPYRKQYEKLIPSHRMRYIETYNASEGFFAIQNDLEDKGMLLMLDYGIFYEFVPMREFEKENPSVLTIDQVEIGVNYALLITTNSGLWRYVIGDTVKFTSTFPHKIIITGRTTQYINAFGEELIVNNTDEAVRLVCEETGARITNYSAAPVFMSETQEKGCHQWLVEFETPPPDIELFALRLDEILQSLNSDYEAKRFHSTTLEAPELIVAKQGLFLQWMKGRGKLGGQHKVPRLANHRQYMETMLALNEDKT